MEELESQVQNLLYAEGLALVQSGFKKERYTFSK